MKNFTPIFKERTDKEQFIFKNNEWIRTDESTIMELWYQWGKRADGKMYEDEQGFTIYGFILNT